MLGALPCKTSEKIEILFHWLYKEMRISLGGNVSNCKCSPWISQEREYHKNLNGLK